MKIIAPNDLCWSEIVRPGDVVMWGQACGEPETLSQSLMAARHEIGGRFGVFLVTCYSKTLAAEQADVVDFSGLVGTAGIRPLSRAGLIDIYPIHYSRLEGMIARGEIGCDVALIQTSRPDADGRISPGIVNDYIATAIAKARVVVAELNAATPFTDCHRLLTADDIDLAIETDRPLVSVRRAPIGDVERRIAGNVVDLVPNGAVVQSGVGGIPDAILDGLKGHRDLGIHGGTISDGVMELMQAGAANNRLKEIDRGVTVTGNMIGSDDLFRFAHRNPAMRLMPTTYTHSPAVLAKLANLISINGAIEVDLTGQVNAEAIGGDYVGTIGGQVDYVRGVRLSPGGRSIIALPSTTPGDKASRIKSVLSGPVTTPRSDVDVIVTEWGRAELAGKTLRQRASAMAAIAHPAFREDLERAARSVLGRD
ncbi:MAG: acetyl-CoA hydrolase/transferase C-terminal domain-containing protein [Hyphomicrobiaceae bacterium]